MKEKNQSKKTESASETVTKKKFSFDQIWNDRYLRSIFLAACVVLAAVLVYTVLHFTILRPEEETPEPERPYIVEKLTEDQIQSIKVQNALGDFLYYRGEDDNFYFEGAESMLYDTSSDWLENNSENMDDILSSVSMTQSLTLLLSNMRAAEEVIGYDKANLAAYGMGEGGKAVVELTYMKGDDKITKILRFGNLTVSGDAYYVMVDGSDSLYTLKDTYISRCIFTDVKNYFRPQVAISPSSGDYMDISSLSVKKKGETFISLRAMKEEEKESLGDVFTHLFLTPEGYYPSEENLQIMLETFLSFSGKEVVEFDIASRLEDPEKREEVFDIFREYSLVDAQNRWVYELNYKYDQQDLETTLYISQKLEVADESAPEGEKEYVYYVYSPGFDCIVEFSADTLPWVEWDLITFMDNHSFIVSIDKVSSVRLSYESTDATFTLTGEGQALKVTSSTGVKVDTDNFRQLYKAILYTTLDGYAEKPAEASKILTLVITLRDGTKYEYDFFGMTARKAYYTLNGSGEFYINRDYVKQMMYACTGILNGETVTVDRKQ